MKTVKLPHQFTPRHYQRGFFKAFIEDEVNRALLCWHRRAGKDLTMLSAVTIKMMQRVGAYVYAFPTYTMARRIMWEGSDNDGMRFLHRIPSALIRRKNEQEMRVELINGSILRLIGTDRVENVGTNVVGAVFSEYALSSPRGWDYIRPILVNNGGWAIINSTPRGRNHFFDLHEKVKDDPAWYVSKLGVDHTQAIEEEAIEEERRSGMSDALIKQEFYCDFDAANEGAIYAQQMTKARSEGRITRVPYDARLPVWTFWDLGAPINTSVWFAQFAGREIRLIACDTGENLTTAERIARMEARGWAYAGHVLPHDGGAMQKSGVSYQEELEAGGLENVSILPRTNDVNAGIQRIRALLPAMIFDEEGCNQGIKALENYQLAFNERLKTFLDTPQHDWCSHPCDALRYLGEAESAGIVKTGAAKKPSIVMSPIEGLGDRWDRKARVISPLD